MGEKEAIALIKALLDFNERTKHILKDVIKNILPTSNLVSQSKRKQHQTRLISTITKNKHKISIFKRLAIYMQSISLVSIRIKVTRGHKIAESI